MRLVFYVYILMMMAACGSRQDSANTQAADTLAAPADSMVGKHVALGTRPLAIPPSGDFLEPKNVFVINREGASVRKVPAEEAEGVDHYTYGAIVTIDVDSGDWYIVKVSQNSNASKGYLSKTDAVNELSIPLSDDELNAGASDTEEGSGSENIEVKLITRNEFYDKAKYAITTLQPAKNVSANNGVLQLKIGNAYKRFTDKITDTYNTYYHPLGEIAMLNAYVVQVTCQECEEYSYVLVDKDTGEETTFGSVPNPSPHKEIISISNEYDGENLYIASVFFHKFSKDTIQQVAHKVFPQWSVVSSIDGFWGNDGWYYVPVLPSIANWNAYSSKREGTDFNFRYIKIRHK